MVCRSMAGSELLTTAVIFQSTSDSDMALRFPLSLTLETALAS